MLPAYLKGITVVATSRYINFRVIPYFLSLFLTSFLFDFSDEKTAKRYRHFWRRCLDNRITQYSTTFGLLFRWDRRSTIYQRRDILTGYAWRESANRSPFLLKNRYYKLFPTDVTPNGTLRRRRSRIPCEDDDGNLMDFLRTSGQDGTRERKSWGSLGIRSRLSLLHALCVKFYREKFSFRSFVGEKGSGTISKKRSVERRLFHRSRET